MRIRDTWSVLFATAVFAIPTSASAETIYGIAAVGNATNLVTFDSNSPRNLIDAKFVTGLAQNESLVGIDVRPATRQLYALGSTGRLYVLDPATGSVTPVGSAFSPPLNGFNFGFDFNPVTDLIRVVSDTRKSFALNPNTGAIDHFDDDLFYPMPNSGISGVSHSAYTNNRNGAATTQLYGIDAAGGRIVTQDESTGELTLIQIGLSLRGSIGGFDISGTSGLAYIIYLPSESNAASQLLIVNLDSGLFGSSNPIGGGIIITAMTVADIPEPSAMALVVSTVVSGVIVWRRRRGK